MKTIREVLGEAGKAVTLHNLGSLAAIVAFCIMIYVIAGAVR